MKVDLSNQVALVTGAARGIGQAIADAFAANGARVVYTDVDGTGAEEAARAAGGSARGLDVTDAGRAEAVLGGVVRDCGRLDVLARAPLLKADLGKGVPPFRDWPATFDRLPSPLLVHRTQWVRVWPTHFTF